MITECTFQPSSGLPHGRCGNREFDRAGWELAVLESSDALVMRGAGDGLHRDVMRLGGPDACADGDKPGSTACERVQVCADPVIFEWGGRGGWKTWSSALGSPLAVLPRCVTADPHTVPGSRSGRLRCASTGLCASALCCTSRACEVPVCVWAVDSASVSNPKIASNLLANCRVSATGSAGVSPALAAVQGLHVCTARPSHRCAFLNHYTSSHKYDARLDSPVALSRVGSRVCSRGKSPSTACAPSTGKVFRQVQPWERYE